MKTYKKVEVEAVNAPSGTYVAGCPSERMGYSHDPMILLCDGKTDNCAKCDRAH